MADDPEELVNLFMQVVVAVVVLAAIISMGLGGSSASIDPVTGQNVTVDGNQMTIPGSVTVEATTGNALSFQSDGHVESDATPRLTRGSWTVCSTVELSSDANQNVTFTVYAQDNESILVQYDAGQWMAFFNDSSSSAKATIDAPDPASGWTSVCGRYNETADEVRVARDSTVSAAASMDGSAERRNISFDWNGRIEEVRAFNRSTTNATIQAYANDPIQPLPGTDRAARYMLDEGSGTSTQVFFAGTSATINNEDWVSGIDGPSLSEGADYELFGHPFSLVALPGGYLDGAPIAFVSWSLTPFGIDFMEIITLVLWLVIFVAVGNRLID